MKMFLRCLLLASTFFGHATAAPVSLKLIAPAGYLTNLPALVRIEALDATGAPDRELWDADVALSASAGFTLSTNRILLRNGVGSGLVALSGTWAFNDLANRFELLIEAGALKWSKARADHFGVMPQSDWTPLEVVSDTKRQLRL